MPKSADSVRPHRDRLVLESITETVDLLASGLKPQGVQNRKEMIVCGMGNGSKAAKLLKVHDSLVISFLYRGVHAAIEIQSPVEWRVIRPDHRSEVVDNIARSEYQHALIAQRLKKLRQFVMK